MESGLGHGLDKGTIFSGVGHFGLILWVVVGDYFFAHDEPEVIEVAQVSMMTEAEFQAIQASAPAPSETPSDEPPAVATPEPVQPELPEPEAAPEAPAEPELAPEPQPEPEPAPEPEPEAVPEPTPEPVPEPLPEAEPQPEDVVVAPEEQPLPSLEASLRPKPKPADRVAPDPVDVPEDQPTSDSPTEATSDVPAETPEIVEPPTEEAAPEESGDVLRTEATEDQDESLGMTASLRPKSRPSRPTPEETPQEPAEDTAAADADAAQAAADAEAAAVAEAEAAAQAEADAIAAAVAEAATEEASSDGGSESLAPTGPPLSAGEIGDVRGAIGNKWSLGTVSSDTMRTTIVVRVSFDPTGKPTSFELIESDGPTPEATNTAYSAAKSAITRAYREGGIPLPPDKYETWKVLDLVFDPNGMRFR